MNEKKTFNAKEQKVQDILRVIDTIEPVIDIIREIFKMENERVQIKKECIEKNGKIEAYRLEVLTDKIDTITDEVIEYAEYINSFGELTGELAKKVFSKIFANANVNARKYIAAILLFTNTSVANKEVFEFLLEMVVIDEELNKAIKDSYKDKRAIYEFIGTNDGFIIY